MTGPVHTHGQPPAAAAPKPRPPARLSAAEAAEAQRLSENGMTLLMLGAHFRKPYAEIRDALAREIVS